MLSPMPYNILPMFTLITLVITKMLSLSHFSYLSVITQYSTRQSQDTLPLVLKLSPDDYVK